MNCKCIREITDFPKEWKYVLITIKTKEEMRSKLQHATLFDWTHEITRLTESIGNLLTGLPQEIKDQYLRIRLRDRYKDKWVEAVINETGDVDVWFFKYKNVFKCCTEGSCE